MRWRFGFVHALRADAAALATVLDVPTARATLVELRTRAALPFDGDALVGLRRLVVAGAPPPGTWSRLTALTITQPTVAALAAITPARFPALRALGLVDAADSDALVAELARRPIAAQLAALDLRGGTLARTGALRALAATCRIDARRNRLARTEQAALAALGVVVAPQRGGDVARADARLGRALTTLEAELDELTVDDRRARYRELVALADRVAPERAIDARCAIVRRLPAEDARAECAALAQLVDDELASDVRRGQLAHWIAELDEQLGDLHGAELWLWRAARHARWRDDVDSEHRALGHLGTLRMRRGDPAQAAALLDRVARHYRARGDARSEAWAVRQQGNVEATRSAYARAEPLYRRALELADTARDRGARATILGELAGVLWARSDFAGAERLLRESIAGHAQDSLELGSAYYSLGAILNGQSRLAEARAAGEQALAIFRAQRHDGGIAQALSLLGELAKRRDDFAGARELLDEALRLERLRGAVREQGVTLGSLGQVALELGDYARARVYCEEAIECDREVGNKYNEGIALLGLVDAALGEAAYADVPALVDAAVVPFRAMQNHPGLSACHLRRGFAAQLGAHDLAAASRCYARSIADAERGNVPEQVAWAEIWLALVAGQRGRRADARAILTRAGARLGYDNVQARAAIEMARAVIDGAALPPATCWDTRMIARVAANRLARRARGWRGAIASASALTAASSRAACAISCSRRPARPWCSASRRASFAASAIAWAR